MKSVKKIALVLALIVLAPVVLVINPFLGLKEKQNDGKY